MNVNFGKAYDENSMEFIAISTSEMEVRLAWLLNVHLRLDLVRVKDVVIEQKNQYQSVHWRFQYFSEEEKFEVNLFENKSADGPLISEWAKWDFILKLDHERERLAPKWVDKIKTIPGISAALEIEITKVKTIEKLIQACLQPIERK
jgi:hypothetical protein